MPGWSTIDDEELKLLKLTAEAALKLQRGCDCEYDYRCGRCEQVIVTYELAAKALKK